MTKVSQFINANLTAAVILSLLGMMWVTTWRGQGLDMALVSALVAAAAAKEAKRYISSRQAPDPEAKVQALRDEIAPKLEALDQGLKRLDVRTATAPPRVR